ncbi:hypothetical protein ACHAW6_002312 [Cyclotella cf. meneghiniana]
MFLPAILGIEGPIDDELRTLLVNGVKTGGLEIRDPTLAAASLYYTSVEATDMLGGTLIRNEPINVEAHQTCVRVAGVAHRKTQHDREVSFHTALMEWLLQKVKKWMEQATATAVAWASCWSMDLAVREIMSLCKQHIPHHPMHCRPYNTLGGEACRDILAHGFWNCGRGSVFNVCICNMESQSNSNTSSSKILELHAKEKRDKYTAESLERCRDFTHLVYSVDGMTAKHARTAECHIAWLLMKK